MGAGQAVVIMGISGAGKSTVGELLATKAHCKFYDADNFHSSANKEKMKNGVALTDEDRMPWLEALRDLLIDHVLRGERTVLACSALKPKYREFLRTADFEFQPQATAASNGGGVQNESSRRSLNSNLVFVYLNATAELLSARLIAREITGTHFMPAVLLQSQIDALKLEEGEDDILEMDASMTPSEIVEGIRRKLSF